MRRTPALPSNDMTTRFSALTKAVSVRLRWLTGDPDLKDRPLDSLHTVRQYDRIYLQASPFFFYRLRRKQKESREKAE